MVTRSTVTAKDGIVVVDKPESMTSHDVVSIMRRYCNTKKVGHGGTLDPMATGVLVVAVGRATKFLQYISSSSKSYVATVLLGVSTDSDDITGNILEQTDLSQFNLNQMQTELDKALQTQRGHIMQAPSKVSAIKINGKRSYDLVRQGVDVQLPKRPVTVYKLEQVSPLKRSLQYNAIEFDIEVTCSSGTYVRSIARDIGEELNCSAVLTRLRRTSVGSFSLDEAVTLDELEAYVVEQLNLPDAKPVQVIPLAKVARSFFPHRILTEEEYAKVQVGGFIDWSSEKLIAPHKAQSENYNVSRETSELDSTSQGQKSSKTGSSPDIIAVFASEKADKLVALMSKKGKFAKPEIVFDPKSN